MLYDIGRSKRAAQAFSLDDVAIMPTRRTRASRPSIWNGASTPSPSISR
jgi:hypothetical protein